MDLTNLAWFAGGVAVGICFFLGLLLWAALMLKSDLDDAEERQPHMWWF